MEILFTFLWKSASVIVLFFIFYKLFLQKETYFKSIRYFLLFGVAAAVCIPFIVIPRYVFTDPILTDNAMMYQGIENTNMSAASFDWSTFFIYLYVGVSLFFLLRFLVQITSIGFLIAKSTIKKEGAFYYAETKTNCSPFSFFNVIVYNKEYFTNAELAQILAHEKVHAQEKHSIDTFLINLLLIVQWFNPLAWLYKKDIEQNLEFIADRNAIEKTKSTTSYQHLLLKTSVPHYQMALANNFYNSLLKKRIIMLQKQRSNSKTQWKFALMIPVLMAFLFTFNSKVIAQQKKEKTKTIKVTVEVFAMGISKKSSQEELDKVVSKFKEKDLVVKFTGIKRNKDNEITSIKIDAKAKSGKASSAYASEHEEGIKPIQISFDKENNNLSIGSGDHHSTQYTFSKKGHKKVMHLKGKGKGKGNSFVFISDNDDDSKETNTWVTKKGSKKIIIEMDEGEIQENDEHHEIIIEEDEDGNEVKKEVMKVMATSGGKEDKFVFMSSDGDKEPLFILDGKEISKKEMEALDTDNIAEINVMKGKKATEKYGDKGKDGVVIIKTKKN